MLTQAYTATQQLQRQISTIKDFQELKEIFKNSGADLIIRIGSSTIWELNWNPIKGTISGVLEVSILPKILIAEEVFEARGSVTFRLEDPRDLGFEVLQDRLIDPIKRAFESGRR